jgi:hypothetical protein
MNLMPHSRREYRVPVVRELLPERSESADPPDARTTTPSQRRSTSAAVPAAVARD